LKILRNNCTADPDIITDVICDFRPAKNKIGIFSYGLTYKKPVASVFVSYEKVVYSPNKVFSILCCQFGIKSYTQASDNSFQNGHINFKENACTEMLKSDSMFFKLLPFFKDVFGKFIRPCPYSVSKDFEFSVGHY
jgi:hypothetical protein